MKKFDSIEDIKKEMKKENYICDDPLAFTMYLSMQMEKPLLLEGEPGVGKTEVAKVHGSGARAETDTPAVL